MMSTSLNAKEIEFKIFIKAMGNNISDKIQVGGHVYENISLFRRRF